MKNVINEYFYYFLCFTLVYIKKNHDLCNDEKSEYASKMTIIASDNDLSKIDKRFSELVHDIDSIIITGLGYDELILNYKDFIWSFQDFKGNNLPTK